MQKIWRAVMIVFVLLLSTRAEAHHPQAIEPLISGETRLMVLSPHPDDECLGAGGLIQRVLAAGGKVKVVFATNGDGFPEGVEMEDHIARPTANDYRKYGDERRGEALKALATLGMKEHDVVFLGFPDGGLCYLLWQYRADPQAYTSPFTRENHPPSFEIIVPHTDYNGHDMRAEIEKLLADFRPTLLATTPPEDQHPDHCATYYFLREALAEAGVKDPSIQPTVLTFLIHYGQWPVGQGSGTGSHLNAPEGFPDKETRWLSLSLQPGEIETKRRAILKYHTQMLVMGRFLLSFARANELFVPAHHDLAKQMEHAPCCWK